MKEPTTVHGTSRMRLVLPIVFLAGAAALLVASAVGVFRSAEMAPWIAGPLLALGGAVDLVRHRRDRRALAIYAVGVFCALGAPFAQVAGMAVDSALAAREAMAELAGRPAPPLAAEHRLNGAAALPERPEQLTVVNFWATWCPPCVEEMPMLQEFAVRHANDPVRMVGATALYDGPPDEELERIRSFLDERAVTYPNLVSPDGSLQRAFHAFTLPTTVLIDGGEVVEYAIGIRGTENLLEEAEERLEEG